MDKALAWVLGIIFVLAAVRLAIPAFQKAKSAIDAKYPVDSDYLSHKHHWTAFFGGWAGLSLRVLLLIGDALAVVIGGLGLWLLTLAASLVTSVGSVYLWLYRVHRKRMMKKHPPPPQ